MNRPYIPFSCDGYVCVYVCVRAHSVMSDSLRPHGPYVVHKAPLSTGFSRQEYWSGLLLPPPGDFPYPGIKPTSPVSPAMADGIFTTDSLTIWQPLM